MVRLSASLAFLSIPLAFALTGAQVGKTRQATSKLKSQESRDSANLPLERQPPAPATSTTAIGSRSANTSDAPQIRESSTQSAANTWLHVTDDFSDGMSLQERPNSASQNPWRQRAAAQYPWGRRRRKPAPSRDSLPTWELTPTFEEDVFTFVRIQFDSYGPFGWHDRWDNDFPDGDWNFSLRLHQATSLKVDPNGRVLRLDDDELLNYPFAYFAGVQYMSLSKSERTGMRRYLQNGGFFMMDDLWGLESLRTVVREMQQVLPGSKPVELSLEHPLFHIVYDMKELPQVTDYQTWQSGSRYEHAHEGQAGDAKPHFLAYYDQRGRMVGLVCHNNDIGDGWEREGEHHDYFEAFSLKHSFPFGINLITYALTH